MFKDIIKHLLIEYEKTKDIKRISNSTILRIVLDLNKEAKKRWRIFTDQWKYIMKRNMNNKELMKKNKEIRDMW